MSPDYQILVLIDGMDTRPQALRYAGGLARRVGAGIIVLVLMRVDFADAEHGCSDEELLAELQARGRAGLEECLALLRDMDIIAQGDVRVGEPVSEAMKFLARGPALHSVVWAGDRRLPTGRKLRAGDHWLAMLKDKLGCPLVAP